MEKILGISAIVCSLVFGLVGTVRLPVAGAPSLEPRSTVEDLQEFANETERKRKLDHALAANARGRMERHRILAELEAGTIDLDAAIALFRPLNEDEPLCWDFLRSRYPEHSDEEILGYQMIVFAYSQPNDELKKTAFVRGLVARLRVRLGKPVLMPSHIEEQLQ